MPHILRSVYHIGLHETFLSYFPAGDGSVCSIYCTLRHSRLIILYRTIKEALGADEVFIWNSVTRSADPDVNTAYGNNHFQEKAIKGLQVGTMIRPVASGAHVDQDGPNSR